MEDRGNIIETPEKEFADQVNKRFKIFDEVFLDPHKKILLII